MNHVESLVDRELERIDCPRCHAFLCRLNGDIEISCRRCKYIVSMTKNPNRTL
jgi:phage FluMu protein Com